MYNNIPMTIHFGNMVWDLDIPKILFRGGIDSQYASYRRAMSANDEETSANGSIAPVQNRKIELFLSGLSSSTAPISEKLTTLGGFFTGKTPFS
jgi:hypothetical protein